jgi:putative addiction module killer protein
MIDVREYIHGGQKRFSRWFDRLDPNVAVKVTAALERLAEGNKSSVKPVGEGVSEYRINFGPGYRIYFGQDGEMLIILLTGGDKTTQSSDIEKAKSAWSDYKKRKKEAALKR